MGKPSTRPHGPPRPSPAWFRLFANYVPRYVQRHFHAVRLLPPAPFDGSGSGSGPIIVYLNHPSWWDPLTCVVLASRFLKDREHYAPIDAHALQRYKFFRRLGFFGVEPDSFRGARQFLDAGLAILSRPNSVLWVTAEGTFTDVRRRPVNLRAGVAHLLRKARDVTVIPLAIEYPFWQERTPEILAHFGEPMSTNDAAGMHWDDELARGLESAMSRLAAASMARDPAAFETLLGGRAGVGGLYDLWRRVVAVVRGERFVAEHGAGGK